MMQLGIFAKTFPGRVPDAVLQQVRDAGFACTQFNLACAGLDPLPETVPAVTIAAIGAAAQQTGVTIAAVSGTYNMIHPDPGHRVRGMARLAVVMQAAAQLGVPMVTLCTGTRDAADMWRAHPDNATPDAWDDLLHEMALAVDLARRHGVLLGIEPEQANVVRTAEQAVALFRAVGDGRLRAVLDPANLFEHEDRNSARRIVTEAVETLAGQIGMAHAKDRDAAGDFCTAGRGVVDFRDFFHQLREAGFSGPVVTHGLTAAEAPDVARFLRGAMAT